MLSLILTLLLAAATSTLGEKSSLEGKIVGGVNTTIEEHPYQVSIQFVGSHICGGSLIAPDVVLTAAHCLKYSTRFYSVRVGSSVREKGGQEVPALSLCNHPKFDGKDYDVSIIKLTKPVELNAAVKPIDLQPVGVEVPLGTIGTITGWGALKWEGPGSENLMKVEVPKVDIKECKKRYPLNNVSDRMTCYGYPEGGRDSCQGDSGGPLVADGRQVGVVSWGYKCATPNKPGVYARLENKDLRAHIDECIQKFK